MGFDIYTIRSVAPDRFALRRVRSLRMGGPTGFFAQFMPFLAVASDQWQLSAAEVLKLAEIGEETSPGLFFDLTPEKPEQLNLL